MSSFQRKFGKYAIHNLTIILIGCYIVGYVLQLANPGVLTYLTLDPYRILHGEVWRLFSWLLVPPESLNIFTIIMLFFYYSIGTVMEKTLGEYHYNVYIFTGLLLTIVGSFLSMGYIYLISGDAASIVVPMYMQAGAVMFSTYYINMSIFLAFAATYPEVQVLLMFVIPVKVKWMGILDAILLIYSLFTDNVFVKFAVGAALLNFVIFYLKFRSRRSLSPKQIKRRAEFRREVKQAPPSRTHKCAVCGRTPEDGENLEFRFCSKCSGTYEYCQDHLFTHVHVK